MTAMVPRRCPTCGGTMLRYAPRPLTRRQAELLRFIDDSVVRRGYAPSFEEIAEQFNYSSLATVHKHLSNLQRKGYIDRRYNEARSITVLVRPDPLPVTVEERAS